MYNVNIKELRPVKNVTEAQQAILFGLSGQVFVYIINYNNSLPQLLSYGELEKIRNSDASVDIISNSKPSELSRFQKVKALDLWVPIIKFQNLMDNKQSQNIDLKNSSYWTRLENLCQTAITQYPEWKLSQSKIKKTSGLKLWLKSLGANDREAEVMSKVLSDFNIELR
jgi:hypothetical protein